MSHDASCHKGGNACHMGLVVAGASGTMGVVHATWASCHKEGRTCASGTMGGSACHRAPLTQAGQCMSQGVLVIGG